MVTRYAFTDPIRNTRVTLMIDPAARLFDALTVAHPHCESRADVSANLDAFYCQSCGWNGRINGRWAVALWTNAQVTP